MTPSPDTAVIAEPERRFQAFVIDRSIAWSLFAASGVAAWWWCFREGRTWLGISLVVATVLVVSLVFAVQTGVSGRTPGKALRGLKVVNPVGGAPIGVPRSLLRSLVVGLGSLPMFGLGLATLAWTAVEDRTRERRGWHDHVAGSLVIDVRPRPVIEAEAEERPRHVVNLTAMKLMPAQQLPAAPVVPAPAAPRPPTVQPASVPPAPGATNPGLRGTGPAMGAPQPPGGQPRSEQSPAGSAPPPAAQPPARQQPPAEEMAYPSPDLSTRARPAAAQPTPNPSTRRPMTWRVTFDTGESFVVEGMGLVGRAPAGRQGERVRHVVPLVSANMSISKTHAQFHLASDGALVVTDRGSTNGSILVRKGVSRELPAGRPATLVHGDRVVFGDRSMQVTREE